MLRRWILLATALMTALACVVPPEIIQAVYRLPTPTPTTTPAPSAEWYVSKTGDDDNDCMTAATSCLTVNAAIEKASDGAAIYIGPGTYAENDVHGLDSAVAIYDESLSLYGAASAPGLSTVISGSGALDPVAVTGDATVVLEHLALIDGRQGLVVGSEANVTLRHAEIRDNAEWGVRVFSGTVLLEDVLVTENPEGAIYNDNGGDMTLRASRVVGNGNRTEARARELGHPRNVVYNDGTLRLFESTVADNLAVESENPSLISSAGLLTIEGSTISGNRVGRGAAIFTPIGSRATLRNTTVSGNSGSGITSVGAEMSLLFTTVAENGLSGLFGNAGETAPMTLRLENTIIENNGQQDCSFQLGHTIVFDRRGVNLSDGSCAFDYGGIYRHTTDDDLLLGPLADNGGPTQTHALLEGNRAIDGAEGPCLATDQRGIGRPVGGGCDVGAYEFTFALTAATPAATLIPVETPTSTPAAKPMVTFVQNANCRKGPGGSYSVTTALELGTQAEAVGRNEPSTWWLVIVPATTIECWVAGSTVETAGDFLALPIVPVEPLPSAPGDFELADSTCSPNLNNFPVELEWSDGSRETGYRLYRNGSLLATLEANTTSYDDDAPKGQGLTYEIEAFSALGVSERRSLSVEACE